MTSPFFTGPNAPERNPPIKSDYYSPRCVVIDAITPISQTECQVTTHTNNLFVLGQLIRFDFAPLAGMDKIDEKTAYITMVINSQNFIAQIDATDCDPFLSTPRQISYVVPVGDINSGVINSYGRIGNITYIEGSFTNIGP